MHPCGAVNTCLRGYKCSPVWPVAFYGNVQVAVNVEQAAHVGAVGLHVQACHLPQLPRVAHQLAQPGQHVITRPVVRRLGLQPLHRSGLSQLELLFQICSQLLRQARLWTGKL